VALTKKLGTDKVEIPHEAGEWIEFRPLTWAELERSAAIAMEARQAMSLRTTGSLTLEQMNKIDEVRKSASSAPVEDEAEDETPLDMATMLHSAIVTWSYEEPVTDENVDDLDPVTGKWAFDLVRERSTRTRAEKKVSPPNFNKASLTPTEQTAVQSSGREN
jgi:hypothetical protein